MNIGPRGLALIKSFEGCRLAAYMPTPNDRPTIGWGATFRPDGKPVQMGDRWTQEQADAALEASVAVYAAKVSALIGSAPTTQAEFDAMCCLAYNIGLAGFASSSVLRLHKLGKYALAAEAFGNWTKQAGVTLKGLVRRRAAEAALYRSAA